MTTPEQKGALLDRNARMVDRLRVAAEIVPMLAQQRDEIAALEETSDPDETPPRIAGLNIDTTAHSLTITFTTDEPAVVSLLDEYEKVVWQDTELRVVHNIHKGALPANRSFAWKVHVMDSEENLTEAPIVFATKPATGGGPTASSIASFGATWKLAQSAEYGTFATGDPWVVGPVRVVDISPRPAMRGTDHVNGSMLNPGPKTGQLIGYGSARYNTYDETLDVGTQLPLELEPGDSLVTTIWPAQRYQANRPGPERASILTVVREAPPADAFRPPYSGKELPVYHLGHLKMELLKSVRAVGNVPTATRLQQAMARPWLGGIPGNTERTIHPKAHMPNYGRDLCALMGDVALAVHTARFTEQEKRPMVAALVQYGIDLMGILDNAPNGVQVYDCFGGHNSGRKWPIIFAGLMLDDDRMRNIHTSRHVFHEDRQTWFVTEADVGRELRPDTRLGPYENYTQKHVGLPEWGIHHAREPWRDNAAWGNANYRLCCNANAWFGQATACKLMGAEELWGHPPFFAYLDRYFETQTGASWIQSWSPWQREMYAAYRVGTGDNS